MVYKFIPFFCWRKSGEHPQGDGRKYEGKKKGTRWKSSCIKFECEDEKKEKMVVNLSSKRNIIFLRNGEVLAMDCKKRCKVGLTHRHF
jgi:hypothetical protein